MSIKPCDPGRNDVRLSEPTTAWARLQKSVPSYPKVNELYTLVCFAAPTIAGSAVSFLFQGGALWCLFEILSGRHTLSDDRNARAMTFALWSVVLAYLVSAFVNIDRQSPSNVVWLWTFAMFPFSFSIWILSDRRAIADAMFRGCAAASYGGLLLAVVQIAFFIRRAEGAAGNPLVFATAATFASGVCLLAALQSRGRWAMIYYGAFVAGVPSVLLSGARAITAAFVLNIVIVWIIWLRQNDRRLAIRVMVGSLTALAFTLLLFGQHLLFRFFDIIEGVRKLHTGNYDSSLGQRLALWREGFRLWSRSPIFGFGPKSAGGLIIDRVVPGYQLPQEFTHFHNVVVTTLVEAGVLGLLAVIVMVAVCLKIAVSTFRQQPDALQRNGATLLLLLLSTFLTAGMSSIMIGHDIHDAVFVVTLVVGILLCRRPLSEISRPFGEAGVAVG
jgi:O-antigen ligase